MRSAWASWPTSTPGFPGYAGRGPRLRRRPSRRSCGPAGYGTYAVGKWHLTAPRDHVASRAVRPVADRTGLRPLLRVPRRRGGPVGAGPLVRPASRRAACPTRRTTTSAEDLVDRAILFLSDHVTARPDRPLLPLPGARRRPRPAPGTGGIHRGVPRGLRPRLGRGASAGPGASGPARRGARRDAPARTATPASRPGTGCPARSSGSSPGCRRSSRATSPTPTRSSAGSWSSCVGAASSTTPCSWCCPTTGQAARAGRTAPPTSTATSSASRTPSRRRRRPSTTWAGRTRTTTTRPAGPRPATPPCACTRSTPTAAVSGCRSSCTDRAPSPTLGPSVRASATSPT